MTTQPGQAAAGWVRHGRVAKHLGLDGKTLRELMRRTPAGAPRPWADVGLKTRPRYRWESLDAADRWLKAVSAVR